MDVVGLQLFQTLDMRFSCLIVGVKLSVTSNVTAIVVTVFVKTSFKLGRRLFSLDKLSGAFHTSCVRLDKVLTVEALLFVISDCTVSLVFDVLFEIALKIFRAQRLLLSVHFSSFN